MPRYEFVEGSSSKFWLIALTGKSFTTTYGRIGGSGASTTKSFSSPAEAAKEYEKLIGEKVRKGYELVGGKSKAGRAAPKAPAKAATKAAAKTAAKVKTKPTGPFAKEFAEAFTTDAVHFMKLSPAKPSKAEAAPRATSGGRPIMAEGQAWPTCSSCGGNLSLYLQFDVEPEMGLGFVPGSHVLVFNCATCDGMALITPNKKVPKAWLSPDNPQTYRVIMNRPAAREAVFPADETMLEQRVTFARADEQATTLMPDEDDVYLLEPDGSGEPPRGKEGFKIGGIPHRIQPWRAPKCSCGAPLGFLFQLTDGADPGWRSKQKKHLGFVAYEAFIHACTKQCSPYATLVIPDR
jgi:predicted DNA-binding WGR domain protein